MSDFNSHESRASVAVQASIHRHRVGVDVGGPKQHRTKRQKLRKRLRERGLDDEFIERCVEAMRLRQEAERRGDTEEAKRFGALERELLHEQTFRLQRLDDSGYKPTAVDPLLRGPARVTQRTAKAARRRKATTRFHYADTAP